MTRPEDTVPISGWVVVASNADLQIQVFGTARGRPFTRESAANLLRGRLDQRYPAQTFITVPISCQPAMFPPTRARR